jgi:hypothetical protein
MAAGFLRNLMPVFARRKDTAQQGSTSSMTWVRLVDCEGKLLNTNGCSSNK